jgi:hypothetical protein
MANRLLSRELYQHNIARNGHRFTLNWGAQMVKQWVSRRVLFSLVPVRDFARSKASRRQWHPYQFCFNRFLVQQGGFMYLLFGPAIAGVLVIGFIQLRDQFSTLR